jgi:outer membrane protein assembly factor BamD (BamD/ComL family)
MKVFSKECSSENRLNTMRNPLVIGVTALLIFSFTVLVYLPTLKNGFVWDDIQYIIENKRIRSLDVQALRVMFTTFYVGNWHPLTWISHTIDYKLWGLDSTGHHLTNIILHGLNAFVVFLLVLRLVILAQEENASPSLSKPLRNVPRQSLLTAGVTALLFGLHPLRVESVAWVSERKDLLCAFFFLLSTACYLNFVLSQISLKRRIWYVTCLMFFMLALMSKPMAVTFPVVVLLLDIYPLRRFGFSLRNTKAVLLEKIPLFALSSAASIVVIFAQNQGRSIRTLEEIPIDIRLLNAIRTPIFYLKKMIIPLELVPFYPFPANVAWWDLQYLLSAILIVVITCLVIWMITKGNYLFIIAWAYYLITLLPVMGLLQVGGQSAADRYTYLPSLSIFLLIAAGISWIVNRIIAGKKKVVLGGLIIGGFVFFAFLGRLTVNQITLWKDSERLWGYVANTFPYPQSDPLVHFNLGNALSKSEKLDEAISEYKKTLLLKPGHIRARNNLGRAYAVKGNYDEAIIEFKRALAINPRHVRARNNLGAAYIQKGELEKAIIEIKRSLAIRPNNINAHNNIAFAYYLQGKYKLALAHCDRVISLGGQVNQQLMEFLQSYR